MMYKAEYDDCTSIRGRFDQYFVFGKSIDCTQWNTDYLNCYQWEKHKSEEAYVGYLNNITSPIVYTAIVKKAKSLSVRYKVYLQK